MASITPVEPAYLSVRELAVYLSVSVRTAYNLVYDGQVPVVRVRGQHRIPLAELEQSLADSARNAERPAATPGARTKRDLPRHESG